MSPLFRTVPTFLFVAVFSVTTMASAEEVPMGMWSWKQESFESSQARSRLIAFCKKHKITHVSQHVGVRNKGAGYEIVGAEALKQLIISAADNGITVNILRGDPGSFFGRRQAVRLAKLDLFLDFNRSLPDGYSLHGIHYDVEIYLTDDWKGGGEPRQYVVQSYLTCLDSIRDVLRQRGSKLELCVDVPFWWDKPEHSFVYNGVEKPLVHHVQDRTDLITIMSYRRSSKDVMRFVKDEVSYATEKGTKRSVGVGLNFKREIGPEEVTTFAGYAGDVYKSTVTELQSTLGDQEAVRRIMLHDYRSFAAFVTANSK